MSLLDPSKMSENERLILSKSFLIWENPKLFPTMDGMSVEQIFQLIVDVEEDKTKRDKTTDAYIDYDDEIVSIEPQGVLECMDITVTGDNLFYANGILTKNSAGLPATADLMIGIIVTEQLTSMGQIMFKQLKNRFCDVTRNIKTIMGIDRPKMKLFELEDNGADVVNTGTIHQKPKERVDKKTGEITIPPWGNQNNKGKSDPFSEFKM